MEIGFAVNIIIFCQQYLRTHELNQASLKSRAQHEPMKTKVVYNEFTED